MSFDGYFDRRSDRFASFYGNERLTRALGRGALFDRLRFAMRVAKETGAKRVLDVGCGSGPLFEPLAREGVHVTGLEPAPGMLELARGEAARFPGMVEVREASWEDLDEHDEWDLAVALGVFDYVNVPEQLLQRLGQAAPSVVASFPSPGLRTEFRKVRYGRGGVSVYGYSRERLAELADGNGLGIQELAQLGRAGYAVHFQRR